MAKHEPTKRKLDEARKEGKTCRGSHLAPVTTLMLGVGFLYVLVRFILVSPQILLECVGQLGGRNPMQIANQFGLAVLTGCLAFCGLVALTGVAVEFAQAGFKPQVNLASPSLKRFNPATGFKRIFSGVKSSWLLILKFTLVAAVLGGEIAELIGNFAKLVAIGESLRNITLTNSSIFGMPAILKVAAVLVVIAIADYFIERRKFRKSLEMEDFEVRRESKEDEGDPLIKALRRALHRDIGGPGLVKSVRRARVVIVERA